MTHKNRRPTIGIFQFPALVTCNYRQLAKLVAVDWFGLMDAEAPCYYIVVQRGRLGKMVEKVVTKSVQQAAHGSV